MRSWVRYSVSAYLGLLLAGSIANPGLTIQSLDGPMASIYEPSAPPQAEPIRLYPKPPVEAPTPPARADS